MRYTRILSFYVLIKIKMEKNNRFDDLCNHTYEAIEWLGFTPCVEEIEEEVGKLLSLGDDALNEVHKENSTNLSFSLAWARNYLLAHGILEK